MAELSEHQRNVLGLVGSTVKATPAGGKVDANQLLFELNGAWPALAAGGTLDLQPLYAGLMAREVPPNDAALVCLLLQQREDRLKMKVKLPKLVETLPPKVRDEMVANAAKAASTTSSRLPAVNSGANPPVRSNTQTPTAQATPGNARQTTSVVPFTPPEGIGERIKASFGGRISASTIVLCVVLTGIAGVVNWMLREKLPDPMKVTLPASLPRLEAYQEGGNVYVYDVEQDFNRPDKAIEEMFPALKSTFLAAGAERVWLCRKVDLRCSKSVAVLRSQSVMWVDPAIKARKKAEAEAAQAVPPPQP